MLGIGHVRGEALLKGREVYLSERFVAGKGLLGNKPGCWGISIVGEVALLGRRVGWISLVLGQPSPILSREKTGVLAVLCFIFLF